MVAEYTAFGTMAAATGRLPTENMRAKGLSSMVVCGTTYSDKMVICRVKSISAHFANWGIFTFELSKTEWGSSVCDTPIHCSYGLFMLYNRHTQYIV